MSVKSPGGASTVACGWAFSGASATSVGAPLAKGLGKNHGLPDWAGAVEGVARGSAPGAAGTLGVAPPVAAGPAGVGFPVAAGP